MSEAIVTPRGWKVERAQRRKRRFCEAREEGVSAQAPKQIGRQLKRSVSGPRGKDAR